jgi:hypothetical protein
MSGKEMEYTRYYPALAIRQMLYPGLNADNQCVTALANQA